MPRSAARFRLSIKDNKSRTAIEVELIEAPGMWSERRYRLQLNGREPDHVTDATLTEVFDPVAPLVGEAGRLSRLGPAYVLASAFAVLRCSGPVYFCDCSSA